jgi:hypothetical protein
LQLYLFPCCVLISDITGKHSIYLLYWQFCMFLQALCCFELVLFKNNLCIKSTMLFYVSAFSLVALGFWILVDYKMICFWIVFCGFIALLCSEKLRECMAESLFWSVKQLFLSFNESEDQYALNTIRGSDELLPPSSNRVGFERNGDSEGGECRALSAIVTVARPSMESDPVWMALL